jgi:hypothetical protein
MCFPLQLFVSVTSYTAFDRLEQKAAPLDLRFVELSLLSTAPSLIFVHSDDSCLTLYS